jgi:hypothetical protein
MNSKFSLTKRRKLLIATVITCAFLACAVVIAAPGVLQQLLGPQVTPDPLVNPHPGLVAWWRFNEGSGTVAIDSSGNGYNGTINGATYVAGNFGQALNFAGNAYVEIDNIPLPFSTPYSVSVWVNPSAYANMFLFGRENDVNWYVEFGSGGTINDFATGPGLDWNPNVPYVTGQWQYFVFVFDGTNKTVYANGALAASTTQTSTAGTGMYVGRYGGYTSGEFQGVVDNVQIYSRALSATEIAANYQVSPDFSSNLLVTVPTGMTDFIATLSWQGTGSVNATIQASSEGTYTEINATGVYQKTTYSFSNGTATYLNIKRIEVSVSPALTSSQSWYIVLVSNNVQNYQFSAETQT